MSGLWLEPALKMFHVEPGAGCTCSPPNQLWKMFELWKFVRTRCTSVTRESMKKTSRLSRCQSLSTF